MRSRSASLAFGLGFSPRLRCWLRCHRFCFPLTMHGWLRLRIASSRSGNVSPGESLSFALRFTRSSKRQSSPLPSLRWLRWRPKFRLWEPHLPPAWAPFGRFTGLWSKRLTVREFVLRHRRDLRFLQRTLLRLLMRPPKRFLPSFQRSGLSALVSTLGLVFPSSDLSFDGLLRCVAIWPSHGKKRSR